MQTRTRVILASALAATVIAAGTVFLLLRAGAADVPLRLDLAATGIVNPTGSGGDGVRLTLHLSATNDGTVPIRVYRLEQPGAGDEHLMLRDQKGSYQLRPGQTMKIPMYATARCPFAPPAAIPLTVETGPEGGDHTDQTGYDLNLPGRSITIFNGTQVAPVPEAGVLRMIEGLAGAGRPDDPRTW